MDPRHRPGDPIEPYLDLLETHAASVHRHWPVAPIDELLGVGRLTVARCLERADPTKGDLTHYISRSLRLDLHAHAQDLAYAPDGPSAVTVPADDCGAGSEDAFIAALDARRAAGDLSRAWPTLSDRERAVLTLLCDGLTLDEIAGRLGVARSTICRALRAAKDRLTRATPTRRRAA